jgi:DNA-binding response OmpR family regulator/two-component sensor histidine kinase
MKKIFLVEDEKQLVVNISLLLRSEGYDVMSANDGLEAMHKLNEFTPDLIISDIMMPYLNGYELFQRIKQNPKINYIPFLFLTAKSDITSIRQGMNLGADDYIIKPFSSDDLLRAIKTRLEKSNLINEQIDEIRDSISKYVPHELRTPLVAILGYSQLVLNESTSLSKEEIIEMVERINFGAKRLHTRIEKFLQLTDLEPVNKDIWHGEEDTTIIDNSMIIQIIEEHHLLKDRDKDFEVTLEPAKIKIPRRCLISVLNEILENATKFSDPGKSIIVNGLERENVYLLEIEDKGNGMSESDIDKIGAFKQFNREILQQEGNGLGLIFVKRVMKIVNGDIKISSQLNKFTKVSITIPLIR